MERLKRLLRSPYLEEMQAMLAKKPDVRDKQKLLDLKAQHLIFVKYGYETKKLR